MGRRVGGELSRGRGLMLVEMQVCLFYGKSYQNSIKEMSCRSSSTHHSDKKAKSNSEATIAAKIRRERSGTSQADIIPAISLERWCEHQAQRDPLYISISARHQTFGHS